MFPVNVVMKSSVLLSSIKMQTVDVVVEDWEPVKDAEDHEFFKVTFE